MTYLFLALIFFITIISGLSILIGLIFKPLKFKPLLKYYCLWLVLYTAFIILGTGPDQKRVFTVSSSPYKLPWKSGIERFVSQGNRSFTSHRDMHLYAWDFWMPIGTKVLASRSGKVVEVVENYDGIGLDSNYIYIEHKDKTIAMYAHIKKQGSLVKEGDQVVQGQEIALAGMVGQTINPHLHFVIFKSKNNFESIPISFSDVEGGVPFAGHFYTSKNEIN